MVCVKYQLSQRVTDVTTVQKNVWFNFLKV